MRLAFIGCLTLACLVSSCGDKDCEEASEGARKYLLEPAHQACAQDADCVVIDTDCAELRLGLCGQVAMNRATAESSTWKGLQQALGACGANCAQCAALLLPECNAGMCMRAEE